MGGGGSISLNGTIESDITYNAIGYGGNGVGGAYQDGGSINPALANGTLSITSYGNGGGSAEVTTNGPTTTSGSESSITSGAPPPDSATTTDSVTTTGQVTTITTYITATVYLPVTYPRPSWLKTVTNSSLIVTQTIGLGAPGVAMLCWLD